MRAMSFSNQSSASPGLGSPVCFSPCGEGADPGDVADERPGEQLDVAGGHGASERLGLRRVVAEEKQMEVHVCEIDLVAGEREAGQGERRGEAGQQEASTIHQVLPLPGAAGGAIAGARPAITLNGSGEVRDGWLDRAYCITMVAT